MHTFNILSFCILIFTTSASGQLLPQGLLPNISIKGGVDIPKEVIPETPAPPAPSAPPAQGVPSQPLPTAAGPHPNPLDPKPFKNGAVYKIVNRANGGVLSVDPSKETSVPAFTRGFNGSPGSKWRLEKSYFGKSFRLHPTLKENAVLDLDRENIGFWGRFFAWGSQKYWNLVPVGEGMTQIRNYHFPALCLTSYGVGNEANIAPCENAFSQQWEFILL